jgi:hypothetical protein
LLKTEIRHQKLLWLDKNPNLVPNNKILCGVLSFSSRRVIEEIIYYSDDSTDILTIYFKGAAKIGQLRF